MTATSTALKQVFTAARPLVEQWLDIAEQMAAIRDTATAQGLDWSQIKALLKAQVQDERDGKGDGKRVNKIIEKAEFASAYADMLGLANMNENNFSDQSTGAATSTAAEGAGAGEGGGLPLSPDVPHDPETGEITEPSPAESTPAADDEEGGTASPGGPPSDILPGWTLGRTDDCPGGYVCGEPPPGAIMLGNGEHNNFDGVVTASWTPAPDTTLPPFLRRNRAGVRA